MLLVGPAGAGKSSLANMMCNQQVFRALPSTAAVTTNFQTAPFDLGAVQGTVVDVPGLDHPNGNVERGALNTTLDAIKTVDVGFFVKKIGRFTAEDLDILLRVEKQLLGPMFLQNCFLVLTAADSANITKEVEQIEWLKEARKHDVFNQFMTAVNNRVIFVANPPLSSLPALENVFQEWRAASRGEITKALLHFEVRRRFVREDARIVQAMYDDEKRAADQQAKRIEDQRLQRLAQLSSRQFGPSGSGYEGDQRWIGGYDTFDVSAEEGGNIAKLRVCLVSTTVNCGSDHYLQYWEITFRNRNGAMTTAVLGHPGDGTYYEQTFEPREYITKCKMGITSRGYVDKIQFATTKSMVYGAVLGNANAPHHWEELDPQDPHFVIAGFRGRRFYWCAPGRRDVMPQPNSRMLSIGVCLKRV